MKCIKCIKVAKGYQLDEIRRVSDEDAGDRVKGGYWKFMLVFLTQGKPHFKYWDKDEKEHLVQEAKGAMFKMPIETWHEVTKIEKEKNNY